MRQWERWLFRVLALGFIGAGIFHARAFFDGTVEPRMAASGHAIFVVVNALAAVGLWLHPRWLVFPFSVLVHPRMSGWWMPAALQA